jgi:CheY-like chemotaxis protein
MNDSPTRIFVVEDEAIVAFEMCDRLEDLGSEVVGPSIHLEHAQQLAREGEIDAAFLDVNLGRGRTSRSVAEILKQRGIPYAFITAYDASQVDFIRPGDFVIEKPVTGRILLDTLRRLNSK